MRRNSLASGIVALTFAAIPALVPTLGCREKVDHGKPADVVLENLIAAEKKWKKEKGKFWRDQQQTVSPEAAKQALGVDLSGAPDFAFMIDPADLAMDPTLRLSAVGKGDASAVRIDCVYDAIGDTKQCKRANPKEGLGNVWR
jgi:hypothetical protein